MLFDFYVYLFLRQLDSSSGVAGTPYYVGKGRGIRAWSKNRAIPRPTDSNFIRIVAKNLSEQDAFELEVFLIAKYGRINNRTGCLRNLTDGGEGSVGWIPKPETLARLSAARKGKQTRLGSKASEETRQKMRMAHLGKKRPPEFSEKMSRILSGVPKSEEHRRNLSNATRGIPRPQCANKSRTGQPHSVETKLKMAAARQKWWTRRKLAISQSFP